MDTSPFYTFKKGERLRKKQHLDTLFQSDKGFVNYPFRVVYCYLATSPKTAPVQILISVPKRRIRKAASRNLIKRRSREAYRQQKHALYQYLTTHEQTLALGLIYIADEVLPFSEINEAITVILNELKEKV